MENKLELKSGEIKKEKTLKSLLRSSVIAGVGGVLGGAIDGIGNSDIFNSVEAYGVVFTGGIASDLLAKNKTATAIIANPAVTLPSYMAGYTFAKATIGYFKK